MNFFIDAAKWAQGSKEDMGELHRAFILKLFNAVILDTPVLSGRLRGNWIISSENPSSETIQVTDPTGSKTTAKVGQLVARIQDDEDFDLYLSNNLPYAYRIEFEGHSSIKAPEGMLRKNFIRITELLR